VTAGPSQVQGAFESNAAASAELTLLRRGGSTVTLGNMITIPVGGGLLYIEPVYVTASAAGSTGSYPSLQRVFAFYGGHPVGFQPNLQEALAQVFTGTSGQAAPGGGGSGGSVNAQVIGDLKQAQQFYAQAQAALHSGNLAAYAQDIAKMANKISNARAAAARAGHGATTSPKPSPGATATPTPSPTASR
jgi:uncharacterized membrane protein (UPF0182 family)